MAQVKYVNQAGQYQDDSSKDQLISYMMNPLKTPSHYIGGCSDVYRRRFARLRGIFRESKVKQDKEKTRI